MGYTFLTVNGNLMAVNGGYAYLDLDNPDMFDWHTLTTDDVSGGYNAYSKAYFISGINTGAEYPNILVPATLDGYPTRWNIRLGNLSENIIRLRFEERTDTSIYNIIIGGTSSVYNSTLKAVYDIPPMSSELKIQYTTALEIITMTTMSNASQVLISYNTGLKAIPQIPEDATGFTTLVNKLWHNTSAVNTCYTVPSNVTTVGGAFMYNNISEFTFDSSWEHVTSYGAAIDNNPLTDIYFESDNVTVDSAWADGVIGGNTWFDMINTTVSGNILHGASYSKGPVTVHCTYGSAIYTLLRYAQASQNYMMRNLRLDLTDNYSVKNISFWGDSLTRRNENSTTQSNLVEQFYDGTVDTVWCWNEGHGGAGSGTTFPSDYGCQAVRWTDDLHVIWIGTNDTILTEAQTIANIQTMISTCGLDGNYIVLQPFGWGYASGNAELYEAAFSGITIDTHTYIIEHGFDIIGKVPTEAEQEQLDNDTVPDIFVDTSDSTHITSYGGQVIAHAVREMFKSLGCIDNTWLNDVGQNTSVTISAITLSVSVEGTETLTATSGNGADITWSSTDESIATVSNGTVTGVAVGECYVIARCGDFSKFCTVTVS